MTFLDLLKQIQKDGPINILGEKVIPIIPSVLDNIVEEFENMSYFRDALIEEKKIGDKFYDTIKSLADILKIEDWTTENIVEKTKEKLTNPQS